MKIFCLLIIVSFASGVVAQDLGRKPEIGVVQNFENDSLLHAAGYVCLVESVAKCFSPSKISEEQFLDNIQRFQNLQLPLYAVNIFMPGELKLVGPSVNEAEILSYVDKVFKRCKQAGVNRIIWGSGGARRVPDGFDKGTAKDQFVAIARKVAVAAKKYNIDLALENLNHTETNFINTAEEALDIVKRVDQPNLRLCVDIYHMLKEGESASVIEKTKGYLVYCEVAEKENRTPPGVHGDDFRPYLAALKKIGYTGKIVIECRWENVELQAKLARENLQKQIDDVYR